MAKRETAKLFRNGRSQAVRLPKEFRFQGTEVRIKRVGDGVLLKPGLASTAHWFSQMDAFAANFPSHRARKQPRAPKRKIFD